MIYKIAGCASSTGMAQTASLLLSVEDLSGLPGIIDDRHLPVKHIQGAQIMLLKAAPVPGLVVATNVGISRPMVWRWQQRYAE